MTRTRPVLQVSLSPETVLALKRRASAAGWSVSRLIDYMTAHAQESAWPTITHTISKEFSDE